MKADFANAIFDEFAAWLAGTGDIAWSTRIAAREADFVPLPHDLAPGLANALHKRGIESLYRHKKIAYEAIRAGQNVIIVTPTAIG